MIGSKLRELRLKQGHKQSYIAYKLGISQTNVSETEKGHVIPPIETLELYATFYGKGSVKDVLINHFNHE